MTETVPLKIDEILLPMEGSSWALSGYKQLKLVAKTELGGTEQWWCEITSRHATTMTTLSTYTLRQGWVRKPTFFQVGKTYTWSSGYSDETFLVKELFQIPNPQSRGEDVSAFAVVTDSWGKQFGMSLSRSDFRRMKLA
ncbi:hypothetical protein SEA_OLICIOUS_73 [Streptomyces phage Olicious]|uniref:Uncharacterized protein n=1 Tax=Streptomyces phage Olicious TaxID=2488981 RepID=A0A3G8FPC2_9CAUD|nr:hypothetical protein SEA_OLICIOUS_73 [Streptomyces phage Olicious]